MIGVILTGHGQYASGLLSAVHMVAGEQDSVRAVEFKAGMSTAELEEKLLETIQEMKCDQYLVLTDLAGGSPFNTVSTLRSKLDGVSMKILTGTNMVMALEAAFSKDSMELDELVQDVMEQGTDGIKDLDVILSADEPEMEDGL